MDVNNAPEPPVRYIEDFLQSSLAAELYKRLVEELPWEQRTITMFGRTSDVPRLTCWLGDAAYTYSGITNHPNPFTSDLDLLRRRCEEVVGARFNSCLCNLYRDGNDSMDWHSDDEPELGDRPVIASVSLGASRTFRMRHKATRETRNIELAGGSLLIMDGDCQLEWEHSLPKRKRVHDARINLTFRWLTP